MLKEIYNSHMDLIDVQLTEQPVTLSDYSSYNIEQFPKIILGFHIKNKFDEERLIIKAPYKPKKILHYTRALNGEEIEPIFFYGIEVEVKHDFNLFFSDMTKAKFFEKILSKPNPVQYYQDYLNQFNLSCDENYLHLCDGVYPIDLKHFEKICINNPINIPFDDVSKMLKISKEQWYLNIGAFGIYILGPSLFYNQ